jgi:hypothetical protein
MSLLSVFSTSTMSDYCILLHKECKKEIKSEKVLKIYLSSRHCRCVLVVRILGYRFSSLWYGFRRYKIFREIVGLERGALSLVMIIEKIFEWQVAARGIKCWDQRAYESFAWPHYTIYTQKFSGPSRTSGGRSVCIGHLRAKGQGRSADIRLYTL